MVTIRGLEGGQRPGQSRSGFASCAIPHQTCFINTYHVPTTCLQHVTTCLPHAYHVLGAESIRGNTDGPALTGR